MSKIKDPQHEVERLEQGRERDFDIAVRAMNLEMNASQTARRLIALEKKTDEPAPKSTPKPKYERQPSDYIVWVVPDGNAFPRSCSLMYRRGHREPRLVAHWHSVPTMEALIRRMTEDIEAGGPEGETND